jgi:hypothetical protein
VTSGVPDVSGAARVRGAGPVAKVDQLVGELLDAEALGEDGGQDQTGVGDRVGVVEHDPKPAWTVGGWHRKGALLRAASGRLGNAILPAQRAPFLIQPASPNNPQR